MKEFVEKLISRLEELPTKGIDRYKGGSFGNWEGKDYFIKQNDAIEIVNQLAEEYKDDFCEWMQDDVGECVYCTKCGQMHIFIDGSPEENDHEFCPYCGKKIKIAPYQPEEGRE